MAITAALVKELRERTGAGMMECKKALVETEGDIDAAVELMRKAGMAKADKKAGRVAAEGKIEIASSVDNTRATLVEVNCETDFAAKDALFQEFAKAVAVRAMASDVNDVEALLALPFVDGEPATIEATRQDLVGKIGENITVRRCASIASDGGLLGIYQHGARIGVVVDVVGGDAALAKDIAMHIAASRPICVAAGDVPQEVVAKEREIFTAQAADSGKPQDIVEKMVEGRVRKFLSEVTLLGQPFVKDPDISVEKLLKDRGARVRAFVRMEVGEGIEKKADNFAEEVMAQARGS